MKRTALAIIFLFSLSIASFAQTQENSAENDYQPLKIISQPKAQYTREARRNNVEGDVKLKVHFRLDGKIGEIQVVTELPYGLTEQAVKAAQQLKFEPAKRKGKAISIIKMVIYRFQL